ncbi:hypothetical protein BGU32_18385 [Clostridioides difficile]|nr:hypothetical protein BGU32_18385 [Clostridioides difficile]
MQSVEEDDSAETESQYCASIRLPRLTGTGLDPHDAVTPGLDPRVLVRGEDTGHVGAQVMLSDTERDGEQSQTRQETDPRH